MTHESPESKAFAALQDHLRFLFEHDSGPSPATVVVIPSVSLDSRELVKLPVAAHFEQRLLFELQRLRRPGINLVYVTSHSLDRAIVDYSISLLLPSAGPELDRRLTLLACDDESKLPLTAKILRQPSLIEAIQRSITDSSRAYLVAFTSSVLERELAVRLGIPLYACDPALAHFGTKSEARKLFREAGVPILEGTEDVRDRQGLVDALSGLKAARPHVTSAVVKLNDSFAGVGNAMFSYAGSPARDVSSWVSRQLPARLEFVGPGETWNGYLDQLRDMGGVVERYVDGPAKRSPSVQLEITPRGHVTVVSTHDQVLAGATGQSFTGCVFPAPQRDRLLVQQLALQAGRALAARGVIGHLSIDFLVHDDGRTTQTHALEINLRMGGATAPYFFLHGLVEGRYDAASGDYLASDGRPRFYVNSDRIARDSFRHLTPGEAIGITHRHGLSFSRENRCGSVLYALGGLTDGKVGVVAIDSSAESAARRYEQTIDILASEASRRAPADEPSVAR